MNHNQTIVWPGDMCFGIVSSKAHTTTLTATRDALVLEGPLNKTFHLPAAKVRLVEPGQSSVWFLSGLRTGCIQIHHEVKEVPDHLLFSATDKTASEVAAELKRLGYKVP